MVDAHQENFPPNRVPRQRPSRREEGLTNRSLSRFARRGLFLFFLGKPPQILNTLSELIEKLFQTQINHARRFFTHDGISRYAHCLLKIRPECRILCHRLKGPSQDGDPLRRYTWWQPNSALKRLRSTRCLPGLPCRACFFPFRQQIRKRRYIWNSRRPFEQAIPLQNPSLKENRGCPILFSRLNQRLITRHGLLGQVQFSSIHGSHEPRRTPVTRHPSVVYPQQYHGQFRSKGSKTRGPSSTY